MSEKLKQCPFCGSLAVVKCRVDSDWGVELKYRLLNDESNYEIKSMIADENYEPDYQTGDYWDIEICRCQSCRAEWGVGTDVCIAELHARIAELAECIGSQMADVYTLKARIAELEAAQNKAFDLVRKLRMYCIDAHWDNPDAADEFNEFDAEVCEYLSEYKVCIDQLTAHSDIERQDDNSKERE